MTAITEISNDARVERSQEPGSAPIAIIDFGSQYTNLIRRSFRELSVNCTIHSPDVAAEELAECAGVVLSGGPSSVYGPDAPRCDAAIFDLPIPILGICYGHQLMAEMLGGRVAPGEGGEYGRARLEVLKGDHLFTGVPREQEVWMSRGDVVEAPPPGFQVVAQTDACPVAAMTSSAGDRYSVQFHPEVAHTTHGVQILRNFALGVCKAGVTTRSHDLVDDLVAGIRAEVGDRRVFLMLSGGIDSTVACVLLAKALGSEGVFGLHVDTGLLRAGETDFVVRTLNELGIHNFKVVDASSDFLAALKGVTDPELKRRAVAQAFLDVKDREMEALGLDPAQWLMGQGTIYPDLIASGVSDHSHTIKTHHNSLLQERTEFPIVEPLKLLYKDEVRRIGTALGLPEDFVWREPFPGPGLSIRLLGEVTAEKLELQRAADVILGECLRSTRWHRDLWHRFPVLGVVSELEAPVLREGVLGDLSQERLDTVQAASRILEEELAAHGVSHDRAECVILPLKSVGIKGDARSYESPVAVSIAERGEWARVPYPFLEELSSRLTNEVGSVNRVVYDLTSGPAIAEMDRLAFLRLITSRDAMTADWAKLEYELLAEISGRITRETAVDCVMLDITQKPPSMMEWE
ncbi:MAG TPA: glutamine-hydrolyzing GMP synthase [Solirubrobacteraceae bacterium]|nr:glutamine-hydrolyzing GMP synthase [Solirubrobacteraceae bacterium]